MVGFAAMDRADRKFTGFQECQPDVVCILKGGSGRNPEFVVHFRVLAAGMLLWQCDLLEIRQH